jgi:predicted nuclease with TOPRIM domain
MGFLWFGKNIDTWQDIGSEKDLKAQQTKLQVEWNIAVGKKEEAQSLYEKYRDDAVKQDTAQSRLESAAWEMSKQVKIQRRLDEEMNLIAHNFEDVQTALDLKDAEQGDKNLSKILGDLKPDKLQDTLIAATQARKYQKIVEWCVPPPPQSTPIMIEAEKDQDWRAALADIERDASG